MGFSSQDTASQVFAKLNEMSHLTDCVPIVMYENKVVVNALILFVIRSRPDVI